MYCVLRWNRQDLKGMIFLIRQLMLEIPVQVPYCLCKKSCLETGCSAYLMNACFSAFFLNCHFKYLLTFKNKSKI